LGQLAYYTLKVGGDHFEFRVFTHLAPLVALTTPLLFDRAGLRPAWTLALSALAWALALPLPWAEHQVAKGQTTMVAVRAGPKLGDGACPAPCGRSAWPGMGCGTSSRPSSSAYDTESTSSSARCSDGSPRA
jgi:hypothetical protein